MKYQPLNDLIDPDVPPADAILPELEENDPDAPNDAYVIGAPTTRRPARGRGSSRRRSSWPRRASD
jgi:hypothetical protein